MLSYSSSEKCRIEKSTEKCRIEGCRSPKRHFGVRGFGARFSRIGQIIGISRFCTLGISRFCTFRFYNTELEELSKFFKFRKVKSKIYNVKVQNRRMAIIKGRMTLPSTSGASRDGPPGRGLPGGASRGGPAGRGLPEGASGEGPPGRGLPGGASIAVSRLCTYFSILHFSFDFALFKIVYSIKAC